MRVLGLDLGLRMDIGLAGRDALIGLRLDDIAIHRAVRPGVMPATVAATTPLHGKVVLLLRTLEGEETLASMIGEPPETGSTVWFEPSTKTALLYDAATGLLAGRARAAAEVVA